MNKSNWDDLFGDQDHIIRDPDIFSVHFARLLKTHRAKTVLDWGCGAGRHVVYLAQQGFNVTGMDPSPTGVRATQKWLAAERLTAKLKIVSPEHIPAPNDSFDAAVSFYAIEHGQHNDLKASIAEIRRVVKTGGRMLITMTSDEDSLKQTGEQVAPGTYAPIDGPEKGAPHYLTTRADIDEFFAEDQIIEIAHFCKAVPAPAGKTSYEAHWAVIVQVR